MRKKGFNRKNHVRRWLVVGAAVVVLSATGCGGSSAAEETVATTVEETTVEETATEEATEEETENEVSINSMETICRAMVNIFVKNVLDEKWHFTALDMARYELDEEGNGVFNMLYMPSSGTKLNLLIEKDEDTYTIEYVLLDGLYEVNMDMIPYKYKTWIDN